jgi:HlyD family secretion protein
LKILPFYAFCFFVLLSGCRTNDPGIPTLALNYSDYIETIDSEGTIQAVNNTSLVTPRITASNITVVYLADEGAHVRKGDTICILGAPELDILIEGYQTDLEKLEAELRKTEADNLMELALLNAQIETNSAQMAITMLDSVQMKFAPDVKKRLIGLEMEKANIERSKLRKKLISQKRINMSEVMQLKSRISIQKGRIEMFQNQLKSLRLTAPCDGIIMHVESPMLMFMSSAGIGSKGGKIEEGSSVFNNMGLLQIPDMKEMQVLVDVPEVDFRRLKEGQKATITVDAVMNLQTTGKIKRKTLGTGNPREQTKIKTYQVILSIDSCHSMIKPGLSAMCRIIVDQVKDTVVVPASAVFAKDSLKIVYIADNKKFRPVIVETGFSNSSKCIVSKGLKGDEHIALIEPPHRMILDQLIPVTDSLIHSGGVKKDSLLNIHL